MRRRIEMRRTLLTLAAGSLTLASGITASAAQQAPSDPTMQQNRPGMMMPQQGGAAGQPGSPPDSRAPGLMGRGDGTGMMCRMLGRREGPGMIEMIARKRLGEVQRRSVRLCLGSRRFIKKK